MALRIKEIVIRAEIVDHCESARDENPGIRGGDWPASPGASSEETFSIRVLEGRMDRSNER